jgi:hypothetical protein
MPADAEKQIDATAEPKRDRLSGPRQDECIKEIADMYDNQYTPREIYNAIERKWGLKERQVRVYLEDIKATAKWESRKEKPNTLAQMRRTLRKLFRYAIENPDLPGALAAANSALDKLCKIEGHYEAETLLIGASAEADAIVTRALSMSPLERSARRAELDSEIGETESND